ncbi:hypothetical protein CIPAW_04G091100 [Carya illinoinensis]|uniref:Uncharacterized protein n=1 Tax=Carya illinoinensis TaxID=32201 RepID=A0A8T1QRF1_CARIL|nr:hypothetical protein CIPAW_04G091100 [Carya illinoinensis]KAG6657439.1 hypothetical protein CIPAW_04G091100 [Carya illinoinensis]
MVEVWWSLLGAAIPAVIAGHAFRMKKRHAEEQRLKSARGREKSPDDIFVCERVCTSKRMLKKYVFLLGITLQLQKIVAPNSPRCTAMDENLFYRRCKDWMWQDDPCRTSCG